MARLVVINPGTPPNAADRWKVPLGRCDQEAAQWFPRRGYLVAFASAGGQAEFDQRGPYGQDGHRLFFGKRAAEIWGPLVEHYLE